MPATPEKSAQAPEKGDSAKARTPAAERATDPDELLMTLADMDDRARAQGFTLALILEKLARDAYGISIIAPPAEPEPEPPTAAA
jgi:hypothetical protein